MINIINEYVDRKGRSPYAKWLKKFKDKRTKAKIIARVDRMELDYFGDSKSIGEGVFELRIDFGPGYRVYYAREGRNIYLLLCGGNKSSQIKDIKAAKKYWLDFQENK